jgi:D-lactate dehydrogenase
VRRRLRVRQLIGYDKFPSPDFERMGGRYVSLRELAALSDIVSLHCPLTRDTHYLVDANALALAMPGAMLINTSRGGLVDTEVVIAALKSGLLGALGIDVYEQESDLFFQDRSSSIIPDDVIQRLVSFPNVIVTGHQAFFTQEAIGTICATTVASISDYAADRPLAHEVRAGGWT